MKEEWFHGDITREESESKLSDFDRKGTFMVRLSTNTPQVNPYTLSMINKKGELVHLRIKRTKENKFKLFLKKHGKTIKIEEAGGVENLLNVAKTTLGLSKPCLGRKYKDIFKKRKRVFI